MGGYWEFILSLLLLEYRKTTTNMPFLENYKCSVINKSMVSFASNLLKYPDCLKLTSGAGPQLNSGALASCVESLGLVPSTIEIISK